MSTVKQIIQMALTASVMLIIFSLGLKTTLREATCLFQRRQQCSRSLLAMFIIMPVCAGILAQALELLPAVEIALVALAVSPVPPILPRKALGAGGSRAYVLGLFVAAAITSIVFIPLAVEIFERVFAWPDRMSTSSIIRIVTISILAPLAVGLALRQVWPAFAERSSNPLSRFATILLIVSVLPILFMQGSAAMSLTGNGTLLVIAVFVITGLIAGTLLGGRNPSDRTVLSLSTASRHPGIALAIAGTNFPNQKLILPAILLYLIVNALLSWVFLKWFSPGVQARASADRQSAA